jgi:hypothetical protein
MAPGRGGRAARRTERPAQSGPGTRRAAAQRRSRAKHGLQGPRAGLAASAARTRAPGGHEQRRRASGVRIARRCSRRPDKGRPAGTVGGTAASNRASSAGRQMSSAPKPGAPPVRAAGVPRGRDQAPHPVRREDGGSVRPQPRSVAGALRGPRPRRWDRPRPRLDRRKRHFPSNRDARTLRKEFSSSSKINSSPGAP